MPVHYVEQLLGAQGPPGYAPRAHCKKRMRDAKDMPCHGLRGACRHRHLSGVRKRPLSCEFNRTM